MKRVYRNILFQMLFLLATISVKAQVTVKAELDSVQILIGAQVHMTISAVLPEDAQVVFPSAKAGEEITEGVEIVSLNDTEGKGESDGTKTVSRIYTLTSFADTTYNIPSQTVRVNGKDYTTNALTLKVLTIETDSLKEGEFYPEKDIQKNPFMLKEWAWLLAFVLLLAVLCFVFVYIYGKRKNNAPIVRVKKNKMLKPHEKALMEIGKVKEEYCKDTLGDQKKYYTQLTDILRIYLQERFGFNAMEMTSSEIIDILEKEQDEAKLKELRTVFSTADLVKFAKHTAYSEENEYNMDSVVNFINATKKSDEEYSDMEQSVPVEDKREKTRRNIQTLVLVVLAMMMTATIIFIIWRVFSLIE